MKCLCFGGYVNECVHMFSLFDDNFVGFLNAIRLLQVILCGNVMKNSFKSVDNTKNWNKNSWFDDNLEDVHPHLYEQPKFRVVVKINGD